MCLSNKNSLIRRYDVLGACSFSTYCCATVALILGLGFFATGFSSYILNFDSFDNNLGIFRFLSNYQSKIVFFPQGLAMCFYGLIGLLVGIYLWVCILLKVGCGFTEFNKLSGKIKIFRIGFPGKKRVINYIYNLENIQSISVKPSDNNFFLSRPLINVRLKLSEQHIVEFSLDLGFENTSLENIEEQAADLSKFLKKSLVTF